MRRRLTGTLLWCLLVPIVGCGRLLATTLRMLSFLRLKTLLMLGGLGLSLSLPNPVTAQFSAEWITPSEQMILTSWLVVFGSLVVLAMGMRSRALRRLRQRMRQRGWFV